MVTTGHWVLGSSATLTRPVESTSFERQREVIEAWAQSHHHQIIDWAEDISVRAAVPAKVSHFVVKPATAEALSKLKTATGSNQSLLQFQEDGTVLVAGVPILVSSLVDATTLAWAVDATQSRLVLRKGTEVTKTYVPQNVSWFISGIARYGWCNLAPVSVIRIYHSS